jgi:hypothetical protein
MGRFQDFWRENDQYLTGLINPLYATIQGYNNIQDQGTDQAINEGTEIVDQAQEDYQLAIKNVLGLLENHPEIDLTPYINQLSNIGQGLQESSAANIGELKDIRKDTEAGVGRYLNRSEGQISSMLDEVMKGSEGYLTGYKRLANQEMPGVGIYRDQITSSASEGLQSLRGMGSRSAGAVGQVLQGSQNNLTDLALKASQYKTQSQKDLANAYMTYGQTRGNAYQNAASANQGLANTRLGLGQFSTSNVSAQQNMNEGLAGVLANIANAQSGMTQSQFNYNEFAPWQAGVNFWSNQAVNPNQMALDWQGNLVEAEMSESNQNSITNADLINLAGNLVPIA